MSVSHILHAKLEQIARVVPAPMNALLRDKSRVIDVLQEDMETIRASTLGAVSRVARDILGAELTTEIANNMLLAAARIGDCEMCDIAVQWGATNMLCVLAQSARQVNRALGLKMCEYAFGKCLETDSIERANSILEACVMETGNYRAFVPTSAPNQSTRKLWSDPKPICEFAIARGARNFQSMLGAAAYAPDPRARAHHVQYAINLAQRFGKQIKFTDALCASAQLNDAWLFDIAMKRMEASEVYSASFGVMHAAIIGRHPNMIASAFKLLPMDMPKRGMPFVGQVLESFGINVDLTPSGCAISYTHPRNAPQRLAIKW